MTMTRKTVERQIRERIGRTRDNAGYQVSLTLKLYDNGMLKVDPAPSWPADAAGWLGAAEYLAQALAVFQQEAEKLQRQQAAREARGSATA